MPTSSRRFPNRTAETKTIGVPLGCVSVSVASSCNARASQRRRRPANTPPRDEPRSVSPTSSSLDSRSNRFATITPSATCRSAKLQILRALRSARARASARLSGPRDQRPRLRVVGPRRPLEVRLGTLGRRRGDRGDPACDRLRRHVGRHGRRVRLRPLRGSRRRAIEPYRAGEEVLVFTKCGEPWQDAAGHTHGDGLRPESIREECDYSLRRLGVERIDLYQFHWPDTKTGTPVEESWGTMAELADEGKIRWAGVCNFSVDLLERCEPIRHVDSAQPPLSLLNPGAREDVIPWAREHGTGVIVYSPMASGLLTGAFGRERLDKLAPDDWRRHSDAFQEPELSRALRVVDGLRPIAERLGCSLPTLAVAWTLTVPGVTGAIVGARRPAQVDDWLPAGDLDLDEATLAEIEQLIAA